MDKNNNKGYRRWGKGSLEVRRNFPGMYLMRFSFTLLFLSCNTELGSDEHGSADGPTSVAGDEGVHCVAGGQSGRCHVAEFVPRRGRECHKGKHDFYLLPTPGKGEKDRKSGRAVKREKRLPGSGWYTEESYNT